MSEWDSDIASLLDDVLQDKEPEQTEEVQATPDTPEPQQPKALSRPEHRQYEGCQSGNVSLADIFAEDDPEPDSLQEESVRAIAEVTGATPEQVREGYAKAKEAIPDEVTMVVTDETDDVAKAKLPKIEFSTPVKDQANVPVPTFTSEELMDEIDVRNFGTLVSLTNRRWHAKIKDRKAAKDAADQAGADGETFEARKRLLVGADAKLKAVHKCIDAARTDHYRMTLPWSTTGINDIGKRAGPRLLPNTMFFEYAQTMGKHKAAMVDSLDEFVQAYPTLIAIAQQKLGTAFNQPDYPRPEVIGEHFALEFDFDPIPSGGDFQGLQDAQVEKLAGALKRKTQQKLENALQDAWARLYEDVKHAANVLSNPDAMFHYTLLEKLREHGSMLKHLNVTDDARIEEIRARVQKELTMHDIKDVREDDALRKRLGKAAIEIRTAMEEYAR